MTTEARRYYVVSPDNGHAAGYDRTMGAETAALAHGDGAHVVDTMGMPYQPSVRIVRDGALAYVGYGIFDGRRGADANLIEAAKTGYLPIVKAFLAKGADPNAADRDGGTALIWAAARGKADVVACLLAAGADMSAADTGGLTALGLAVRKKRAEVIDLLRAAGADDVDEAGG